MEGSEQVAHSQDTSLLLGSGMVESVTKLVEAQLKGAGMHWQRGHVNPVLVLRNAVCNQRWPETWQACVTQCQTVWRYRRAQRTDRRLACWAVLILLTCWRRSAAPPPPSRQHLIPGDRLFSDARLLRAIALQKISPHPTVPGRFRTYAILFWNRCVETIW